MKKFLITLIAVVSCLSAFAQIKSSTGDRAYWNGFVDYVAAKGLTGSDLLNRKDLDISHKLFEKYNELNGRAINYTEFVTRVQTDIVEYRKKALDQIHDSKQRHDVNPVYPLMFRGSDEEFMKGLSKIDGFAGVLTTAWKFPKDVVAGYDHIKLNDLYYAATR